MRSPYFHDARDWFVRPQLGLFVHWGIYAVPAWQEQHQFRQGLTRAQYLPFMQQFNPTAFDPEAWLDQMQAAGMSYLCFTTKHIDGFCMWDTAQTDYKITNTPYGRDSLALLADACHRRGVPLCLYYSIADMHHPNYPNAGRSYELPAPEPGDEPDLERYLAYVTAQVRELCTQYGDIHGFWWDAHMVGHQDTAVNALIHQLQPHAVINNRGFDAGDFGTPERDWDESVNSLLAFTQPIEACQSIGSLSWGYKTDEDYFADSYLLQNIDKILAKGGNYLLNVGPTADGVFPPEAQQILTTIGDWYGKVREAFDDVEPASTLTENRDVLLTRRGNTLYVHLYTAAATSSVCLPPLDRLPHTATLLNTGEPVCVQVDNPCHGAPNNAPYLRLRHLPVNTLGDRAMVIKLEFDTLE